MKRRQFVFSMIGATATGLCGIRYASTLNAERIRSLAKVSKTGYALGTNVVVTVYHPDRQEAETAISDAFEAIERVEGIMSLYRPNSQLSELNRRGFLENPHPMLVDVLEKARQLSNDSSGAFDVSVQPLWATYNEAAAKNRLPTAREIANAQQRVNWQGIKLSPTRITLDQKGMALTLNGIAQGFAADAASQSLKSHGIQRALIDSGEIGTVGLPVSKNQWTIGIKHPRNADSFLGLASLQGRCLATSGDYESHFTADFDQHHLLDPHTGQSPRELSSVTIAAPTAMEADALSTAVFILGLERGKELIEHLPGVDALFVDKSNRTSLTTNFPLLS